MTVTWGDEHKRLVDEIDRISNWEHFYSSEQRQLAPDGGGRLQHLVPDLYACVEDLARRLAEIAWCNNYWRMSSTYVNARYLLNETAPSQYPELVKQAESNIIAWEAVGLMLTEKRPVGSYENGVWVRGVAPCPPEALEFAARYMLGEVKKPKRNTVEQRARKAERNDAIRCAVYMASESGLSPTAENENGNSCCTIVAEIFGETPASVKKIWSLRECAEERVKN